MRYFLISALALTAPAMAADGPMLAQSCLGCHGPGAQGMGATVGIAGRPAPLLIAQMNAFRANERPGTIMGRIARGYSETEITAVAAYLAQGAAR